MPVSEAVLDGQIDTHAGVEEGGAGALHTQSKIAWVHSVVLPVLVLKCATIPPAACQHPGG